MTFRPLRGRARWLVVFLALAAPACGKSQVGDTGDPEENLKKFELQEIGFLYKSYQEEKGRPPTRLSDLQPQEVLRPEAFQALKSGRCVAVWGVDLKKPDAARTLLAYRKEVATEGGWVIMADETIKKMTPEDFRSLHKPKS